MNFKGKGQPLTARGLGRALEILELGPEGAAPLWAVVEVETAGVTQGFGFRPDRRPQILFERHKFREFTARRFDREAPQVSGAPGAYGTPDQQYARLDLALALAAGAGLAEDAALAATSWGMGQVMGFNHAAAGHAAVADMVAAMKDGEDGQLAALATFIAGSGLAGALRRRDWTRFARRYNGRNYWRNRYDLKLAGQHARFAGGALPSLELRTAQAALLYLGHSPGRIDGLAGPRTRAALARFRHDAALPGADALDSATLGLLLARAGLDS